MRIEFTASTVSCYTENDVLTIGVGDDPVSPKNYIIISRLDDGGSVDDSIGIQTHLSEAEVSDAIKEIYLSLDKLIIKIEDRKKDDVHASEIVALLPRDDPGFDQLKKYVHEIFYGSSVHINVN